MRRDNGQSRQRVRQRDRGEKKEWEVCQSHIISSHLVNPYYMYHCYNSWQYMFGFHLCSYSVPYITITNINILEEKNNIWDYSYGIMFFHLFHSSQFSLNFLRWIHHSRLSFFCFYKNVFIPSNQLIWARIFGIISCYIWNRVTTQVEAKCILYWVRAMIHITWINRTGQYDKTLTQVFEIDQ